MRRLNLLFIASGRNIGLTFNLSRLAIALKEIGHKVVVVSEPREEEKDLGEELERSGIQYYAFSGLDTISVKNSLNAARIMGKIIDYYNIDAIHAQGVRQLFVAFLASKIFSRRKKIGIVTSIHSTLAEGSYNKMALLAESFVSNICADLVMPVAESVANQLVNFGLIPSKVTIIYNGIDVNLIDRIMLSDELPALLENVISSSDTVVGYFARLAINKGHGDLIRAISEISRDYPTVKLVLAGNGPLRHELENSAKHLGVNGKVIFMGKIEHRAVYKLLMRVDIYAFPSSAELFPYAILEAMAARKPIVATRVGGVAEVIKNGETGILVPPRDYAKLAEGIEKLIENPIIAKQMGENCRRLIEDRLTLPKIASNLTKCYEFSIRKQLS